MYTREHTYRLTSRTNILVVLYHHLATKEDSFTSSLSVSTDPELFEKHIRYYARNYDLIGADDLLSGNLPRKPLLVTFDDAYRSVCTVAGPLLKSVSAPSLFFINPGPIIRPEVPLDNLISHAAAFLGLPALTKLCGASIDGLTSASQLILRVLPTRKLRTLAELKKRIYAALATTEVELRASTDIFLKPTDFAQMEKFGIEIGNHSMSHTFFRSLSDDELLEEIGDGRTICQELSRQSVSCLSVPYGSISDATPRALEIAFKTGHEAVFLVAARSNRMRQAPNIFYRVSMGRASTRSLPYRLNLLPFVRSIVGMSIRRHSR